MGSLITLIVYALVLGLLFWLVLGLAGFDDGLSRLMGPP